MSHVFNGDGLSDKIVVWFLDGDKLRRPRSGSVAARAVSEKNSCERIGRLSSVLSSLFLAVVASLVSVFSHGSEKPNIILIMADDLGVETINAYGGEYYTPHIDELSRAGVIFEHAHATPVCTPTRTRIMTARENAKNYKAFGYLDPDEQTFGHLFKNNGYVTGIAGKWQLSGNGFDGLVGATPEGAGFDESLLWQVMSGDARGSRYWGPTLTYNGVNRRHEMGFGPDILNRFVLNFIERHQGKRFLLYYPMVLPHDPFVPTPDSPNIEGDKTRFSAMVTYMDKMIGNVMRKLEELGLEDNTIVIFTGDNGTDKKIVSYRDGHAVKGGKGTAAITGTHVPLIVRWSNNLPAGERRDGLFDLMDVLPTIADLAGIRYDTDNIDGVSQAPVLRGDRESVRDWIFMHYAPRWVHDPSRFVFDQSWKLYGDGRFVELNPLRGTETPISEADLTPKDAERRRKFQSILASKGDGPLDQTRYPFCEGRESLNPDLPATIAGCKMQQIIGRSYPWEDKQ